VTNLVVFEVKRFL